MKNPDNKYRKLLERMTDGFVSVSMAGNIVETNDAFCNMVDYTEQELMALTYRDLTPEKWHAYEQSIVESQILPEGHSVVYEKEYRRKDGTVFPIELRTFLIKNEADENEGMWAMVRDITEKKRNMEVKEVLMREIHHRVKNNLAIVSSLLNFQMQSGEHPALNLILTDIQLRIRSIALIHEYLYKSENLDAIPLASYIAALGEIIHSTFSAPHIDLAFQIEPVEISIEKALPVGLIINELLTNAFKYAFPQGERGTITISLKNKGNDSYELKVSDNGIGLPESISLETANSMGFYIIRILTDQLEGSIKVQRKNGTSFRLQLRIPKT